MSESDTYTRSIDYNAQQTDDGQVQGASLNIDFDNLANAYNANASRLNEIRRSDSTLALPHLNNRIVDLNSLGADVLASITLFGNAENPLALIRGQWTTATDYVAGELVTETVTEIGAGTYICLIDHTSGTFLDDLSNDLWFLLAGSFSTNLRTVVIVTDDLDVSAGFISNTFYLVRPVAEALVTITIPDATTVGFIDGVEASFHLDAVGSILIDTPSSPPITEIEGAADQVISGVHTGISLLADVSTGEWHITQDSRPSEVFGVTLFPTTAADPIIAGYNVAVIDNDDVRYDDPSITITTPVITNAALDRATAEEIFVFIGDAGVVSDLLDNDLIITVVMNKTPSNARDCRVFSALYIRDSGGTEVLIKETATSGLIVVDPLEQNLIFTNVTADISLTDRVVIKSFGFKDASGGTNPAIEAPLGGKLPSDTPARLKVPQSLTSVSHNSTLGLQGGTTSEFFHMTELQNDTFPGIKGGDIASADPLVIDTDGSMFDVTGTTDFADMTVATNRKFQLQFDGILTVTDSATMILPGGADITTAAGDVWDCQAIAANTVLVTNVTKADGTPVVSVDTGPVLDTEQATTSGTSVTFNNGSIIPAGTKRVTVMFEAVSLTTNTPFDVTIGDAGGLETSGYVSTTISGEIPGGTINNGIASTAEFAIIHNSGDTFSGTMVLTLKDAANNTWIATVLGKSSTTHVVMGGGQKSLSAELTQLQISGGTFDGGSINVMYE